MPLSRAVRLFMTRSAHLRPTAPLTLPLSQLVVMLHTLESMEFTQREHEVCRRTEASMAGTEPTLGGRGQPRLKETLNAVRREVTDMGRRRLTQDQVATKCQGVFASHTRCPTARKFHIRVATR